jgi:hypothetical protein
VTGIHGDEEFLCGIGVPEGPSGEHEEWRVSQYGQASSK